MEQRRDPLEDSETEAAAAEAASIGGVAGDEDLDPADRAVYEAGGGEAEGFEQSEELLIEHASHGDQHSARMALYQAGQDEEAGAQTEYGEADDVRSSEFDPEDPEGAAGQDGQNRPGYD
jgi:hypothetical protein